MQPSREVINDIVMNYLVIQGYKEGAYKFMKEAGVKGKSCFSVLKSNVAEMDDRLIDERIEVRKMIERGQIEEAIKKMNEINPEILDTDRELYFEMKR